VQIVNEQNCIEAFEPFFSPIDIEEVDIEIAKSVGDPAFWYFELGRGPIYGSIEDIRRQFRKRKDSLKENPFVVLQILSACQMEGHEDDIRIVRDTLIKSIGMVGANAWLDTNVLSPKIRNWLGKPHRTKHSTQSKILIPSVLAVTDSDETTVLAPEELEHWLDEATWNQMRANLASTLKSFGLKFADLRFFGNAGLGNISLTSLISVQQLKRETSSSFARTKSLNLRQITKSYFEDPAGALRVVCTFSSRYEGKGKRKYWFGYHETWDRWLEGSKESFLLLGCIDTRMFFALPLRFIRSQLPHLRTTGTGKDKYWHIDIVDLASKKNLLDLPRLRQAVTLAEFTHRF